MIDTRVVGAYISELRRDADMSEAEMASKLNVTHQAVSKWENGLALPDVQTLMNLAGLFGVSIGQILSGGKRASHVRRDYVEEDPDRSFEKACAGEVDPDCLMELAPFLGSEALDKAMDLVSEDELCWEHLAGLAPSLSKEARERAFEKLCAREVDPDFLMEVAPFISRDKLKKAVDLVAEGELCEEHIVSLAPHIGSDALRRAIGRIPADSIDLDMLARLAPFLGPDFVEELIFRKVRPEQVGTAV